MEQTDNNTGQRLATLEEWSSGIERRVSALEKSSDVLTQVQIAEGVDDAEQMAGRGCAEKNQHREPKT